jgi:hypothetical protein
VSAATLVCGDFKLHANASPIAKDPIDRNVFSVRVRNALYHASIVSWEQLQRLGKAELLTIRGIGVTAVEEILDVLGSRGVRSTTPKALASRMMEREASRATGLTHTRFHVVTFSLQSNPGYPASRDMTVKTIEH